LSRVRESVFLIMVQQKTERRSRCSVLMAGSRAGRSRLRTLLVGLVASVLFYVVYMLMDRNASPLPLRPTVAKPLNTLESTSTMPLSSVRRDEPRYATGFVPNDFSEGGKGAMHMTANQAEPDVKAWAPSSDFEDLEGIRSMTNDTLRPSETTRADQRKTPVEGQSPEEGERRSELLPTGGVWHRGFDHIYITSLAHREDRRKYMRELMQNLSVPLSKYSFVDAVTFKAPDPIATTALNIDYDSGPARAECCREVMTRGDLKALWNKCTRDDGWDSYCPEYGCSLSHMKALYLLSQSDYRHALVLEDDAVQRDVLFAKMADGREGHPHFELPPDDWAILKLEGCHDRHDNARDIESEQPWHPSARHPDYGTGALAYSRDAADWLLKHLLPKLFVHHRGHHAPWSYDDMLRHEVLSPANKELWPGKRFLRPAKLWFAQDWGAFKSDINNNPNY